MRTVEWPCLILDRAEGGVALHQVIARSFRRTRIHHHCYGAPGAVEAAAAQADHWRSGALARQSALEAGAHAALPSSPELERFRGRLRAALLDGPLLP
jgi:hypothetical protein